jgi:hypothetical protein
MQISQNEVSRLDVFRHKSGEVLNYRLAKVEEENRKMEDFLNKTRNSLYLSMLSLGTPMQQITAAKNLSQMHNICPNFLSEENGVDFFAEIESIISIAAA